jgi:hypothetical protein
MKLQRLIGFAFLLLALGACGTPSEEEAGDANALWESVKGEYKNWDHAPGFETPQESSAPHSARSEIWINSILGDALNSGGPLTEWPEGSIIVKEGTTNDGELNIIALMEKREAWYWAELDGSDNVLYAGEPAICTGCHESGDDYVRAFSFPN